MGEKTEGSIKKETELNPEFQQIRENIEKLDGLNRYMNFSFRRQDLEVSFFDNFCWGKHLKEEFDDMEFSLILRGTINHHTEKQRRVDRWGWAYDADIRFPDFGLIVYGHSVYNRQQTYMELVYEDTKRVYETYYQQSEDGIWRLRQAVNKNGEVFNPEDLCLYRENFSENECVLPGNDQIIELTKDRLSIGYVSHKE